MSDQPVDFTVAICTYNGSQRLPQVFKCLEEQTQTSEFVWEVVVVDNNSADNTATIVQHYGAALLRIAPLRYVFEAEQGLAFARQRAIQVAMGEFVAFLDDDNLPASDWVSVAYHFGITHPTAGAHSGRIWGKFESNLPDNFARIQSLLALQDYGESVFLFCPSRLHLPPGAGLVVRKQAWLESVPDRPFLVGRVMGQMLAGEDYEILLHLHQHRWDIWYEPAMRLDHVIPAYRLERSYLRRVAWGAGLVMCHLWMMQAKSWQKPWVFVKTLLGNFRHVILILLTYRTRIMDDRVAATQLEFFWAATISPFFFVIYWYEWQLQSPHRSTISKKGCIKH